MNNSSATTSKLDKPNNNKDFGIFLSEMLKINREEACINVLMSKANSFILMAHSRARKLEEKFSCLAYVLIKNVKIIIFIK
jgi:hypothetical protein